MKYVGPKKERMRVLRWWRDLEDDDQMAIVLVGIAGGIWAAITVFFYPAGHISSGWLGKVVIYLLNWPLILAILVAVEIERLTQYQVNFFILALLIGVIGGLLAGAIGIYLKRR